MGRFERTKNLVGATAFEKLTNAKVLIFGVGGVGGFVTEALARSGIGYIEIVDKDVVSESNINRQIIATTKTIGQSKVEAFKERIMDINPDCTVVARQCFYLPDNKDEFDFSQYDYVIDAVDTVTAKLSIIEEAKRVNVPIISAMGAGNKLDPTKFEVADIFETSVCPLAKVMRRELKKRGISKLKVVYSKEEAKKPEVDEAYLQKEYEETKKRPVAGSIAFVPSVAGLIMASEVVKDLCN